MKMSWPSQLLGTGDGISSTLTKNNEMKGFPDPFRRHARLALKESNGITTWAVVKGTMTEEKGRSCLEGAG